MISLSDFDQFIGQEVHVKVEEKVLDFLEPPETISVYSEDSTDSIFSQIRALYPNIHVRCKLPGRIFTQDYRLDRLNIHFLEKDGRFFISKLTIG